MANLNEVSTEALHSELNKLLGEIESRKDSVRAIRAELNGRAAAEKAKAAVAVMPEAEKAALLRELTKKSATEEVSP